MSKPDEQVEIVLTDCIEDPSDDAAFAVRFEVKGPGNRFDIVRISFSEDFVEHFFKIRWNKNLSKEEHRIVKEKRELFVHWALVKVQQYLDFSMKESKFMLTYEKDAAWAEKIQKGLIPLRLTRKEKDSPVYFYTPK